MEEFKFLKDDSNESVTPQSLTESAKEKLKQLIDRIERLEDEKSGIQNDIKDVYAEAKTLGYDTKALRKVIRDRKLDRQEREELEMVYDLYMAAIGE